MSGRPLQRWKALLLAVGALAFAGGVLLGLALRPGPGPAVGADGELPPKRVGVPARGAEITDAMLDREIPPAPADAVAYDVREPLRNGVSVARKSRWLWVPDGSRLALSATASGKLAMAVPVGTTLWKEFFLQTEAGPQLIERRVLRKVEATTLLENGGWRFWTAHYLPEAADGVHGFDATASDALDAAGARRWLFKPDEWLPTQAKSAATEVSLRRVDGSTEAFVFPGETNCDLCHAGASASFASAATEAEVIAFALHPTNLTPESVRALVARGWVEAPPERVQAWVQEPAPPADPATARVEHLLRNNCVSCHAPAARANGRDTAFVLDPVVTHTRRELSERLAARAAFMGPLGKPIVTPGRPRESEIVLRLRGEAGRRRMPPREGGVPEPDLELASIVEAWIAGSPSGARPAR